MKPSRLINQRIIRCCRPVDDEDSLDTKLTEIDYADDEPLKITATAPARYAGGGNHLADPFAEKFEEEEVVIDSFVSWDDVPP